MRTTNKTRVSKTVENIPVSRIVHPAMLSGETAVPGDKSISHRVAMLAGLASGKSTVEGYLESGDCISTLRAMGVFGASSFADKKGVLTIEGTGGRLLQPAGEVDLGNSGTGMRLLAGVIAGHPLEVVLTGDDSLRSRPMKRIQEPLQKMGADVRLSGEMGTAPITVHGKSLQAIDYLLPVASAQVKSCVLLAALYAKGLTRVTEPLQTRNHTEKLFELLGIQMAVKGLQVQLEGYGPSGPPLKGRHFVIPGDFSSASFWLAAAAMQPGRTITVRNAGLNPRRTALLDVLEQAGAEISISPYQGTDHVEPAGDITVKGGNLRGMEVGGDAIPNLIDEIPIIAAMAAVASGTTVIRDAAELRVKEADRIACVAANLKLMGVDVEEYPDGMRIAGGTIQAPKNGVRSYGDHRIAMSMAILATLAPDPVVINNVGCVDTSYPEFWDHLQALGGRVE